MHQHRHVLVWLLLVGLLTVRTGMSVWSQTPCSPEIVEYSDGTLSNTHYLTEGPDGAMWITADNAIGKMSADGTLVTYPAGGFTGLRGGLMGVASGPDGNLWVTEGTGNRIDRVTTEGVITDFAIPPDPLFPADIIPYGITSGSDGNLWFAEYWESNVSRITTEGAITQYPVNRTPYNIAAGSDGNLWFTEFAPDENGVNYIGKITTAGVITDHPLPSPNSSPFGIAAGPDGNLWFTELTGNRIGKITPAGVITEYDVPGDRNPYHIAQGSDGNLWFTQNNATKIGRISTSGTVTEYDIPSGAKAYGIAPGPGDAIWFTIPSAQKIGKLTPCVDSASSSSGSSQAASSVASAAASSPAAATSVVTSSVPTQDAPNVLNIPRYRGSGLGEHAAALHFIFKIYGLQQHTPYGYSFDHENIRPAAFASEDEAKAWLLRTHAACCSMFRYLTNIRERRPAIKPGYIDWITGQVARAIGEDFEEVKAALLGFPHEHSHTSAFLRSITEAGCLANPYFARSATGDAPAGEHDAPHAAAGSTQSGTSLGIRQHDVPGEIAFAVLEGDGVFLDYAVNHTKEMHLIVVRNDLQYFHHVHPERDAEGVWRVPFVPPAPGMYWIYADFMGSDGRHETLRFEQSYEGEASAVPPTANLQRKKNSGDYTVIMSEEPYGEGILFTFHVRDRRGRPASLEPYLGAMGHGIMLSPSGAFIHTHPSPAGDTIIFHAPVLTEEFHRVFLQFQIRGEVHTVEFDVQPLDSARGEQ